MMSIPQITFTQFVTRTNGVGLWTTIWARQNHQSRQGMLSQASLIVSYSKERASEEEGGGGGGERCTTRNFVQVKKWKYISSKITKKEYSVLANYHGGERLYFKSFVSSGMYSPPSYSARMLEFHRTTKVITMKVGDWTLILVYFRWSV